MRLNAYEYMGSDDMHFRVLKELVDEVAKLLSIILKKSWVLGKVPGDWRKGNITPKFVKRRKEDLKVFSSIKYCFLIGYA